MGNSTYQQFFWSKTKMLTAITGVVNFGATGSVSSIGGTGVQGVTLLTTGLYKIKLVENFNGYVKFFSKMYGGVTGNNVASGSLVTGTAYQITAVGSSTWSSAGFDADFTAAVGSVFVATGTTSGTGTAKALTSSGVAAVELLQSQSSMLQNNYASAGRGSAFTVACYDYAGALVAPTSGSAMGFMFMLRNSSVSY